MRVLKMIGLIMITLALFSLSNDNYRLTVSYNNDLLASTCPALGEVCSTNGFNILCSMVNPLEGATVTSEVCDDDRSTHYGIDLVGGDWIAKNSIDGYVINITQNDEECGWTPEGGCGVCSNGGSEMGNSVTIQGIGNFTHYKITYMHLDSIDANVLAKYNDKSILSAGETIGVVGNTGCSSGRHLHFQVEDPQGNIVSTNNYFRDPNSINCSSNGIGSVTAGAILNVGNYTGAFDSIIRDSNGNVVPISSIRPGGCPGARRTKAFYQVNLNSQNFDPNLDMHDGVDLNVDKRGYYAVSVSNGKVTSVRSNGTVKVVDSTTNIEYGYFHLENASVVEGQSVIAGQTVIGEIGNKGCGSGNCAVIHLHFQMVQLGSPTYLIDVGGIYQRLGFTCHNDTYRTMCSAINPSDRAGENRYGGGPGGPAQCQHFVQYNSAG